jgi:hypothetical protein
MAAPERLDPRPTPERLQSILLGLAQGCDCCDPEAPAPIRSWPFYGEGLEAET